MPYIPLPQRPELEPGLRVLCEDMLPAFTAAKLNYVMCRLANAYMEAHGMGYATIEEVQGVFHGAAREFDRCVADEYEKIKLEENGTVWSCTEPKPTPLTNAEVEALMIYDGIGNSWMRCPDEPDCELHVVGHNRVYCANCAREEGEIE